MKLMHGASIISQKIEHTFHETLASKDEQEVLNRGEEIDHWIGNRKNGKAVPIYRFITKENVDTFCSK